MRLEGFCKSPRHIARGPRALVAYLQGRDVDDGRRGLHARGVAYFRLPLGSVLTTARFLRPFMSPDDSACFDPYGRLKGTGHDKLIAELFARCDRLTREKAALEEELARMKASVRDSYGHRLDVEKE